MDFEERVFIEMTSRQDYQRISGSLGSLFAVIIVTESITIITIVGGVFAALVPQKSYFNADCLNLCCWVLCQHRNPATVACSASDGHADSNGGGTGTDLGSAVDGSIATGELSWPQASLEESGQTMTVNGGWKSYCWPGCTICASEEPRLESFAATKMDGGLYHLAGYH